MVLIDFDEEYILARRTERFTWARSLDAPIRLRIGDADLLGWEKGWPDPKRLDQSKTGMAMSIVDVAWWGLVALNVARETGRSIFGLGKYADTGNLLFKTSGGSILVHSTPYKKTAQIPYEKLESAWREFADRVRQFILENFPALKDEPYYTSTWEEPGWQEWLAGEERTNLPIRLPMVVGPWGPTYDQYNAVFDDVDAVETDNNT